MIELARPEPKPGEVLVRLSAAGVNPIDWKLADGMLNGQIIHTFPLVLGVDGAGHVEQVGPGVSRFKVGDRVYGLFLHAPVGSGTYAEYVTVPEGLAIAHAPRCITAAQAAAVPTSGMAALQLLDMLAIPRGQTLLIVGATGGVGSFATQLAAQRGIRVIATARADTAQRMRVLGAAEIVDHGRGAVADQMRASHPRGVDAMIDLVSDKAGFAKLTAIVRDGGAVASTLWSADPDALRMRGLRGGNFNLRADANLLRRLAEAIDSGRLRIPIQTEIPLDRAPTAIAESRAGKARGKTVIVI
jgi:NADPH:quinone reductase-like Zn-dependent oxidoreductase